MASILFDEVRGDRWLWTVQILEDGTDEPVTGLTDYTAEATIKKYVDQAVVLSTTTITVIDDSEGYITIEWAAADTAGCVPGVFWCDVQFTDGTDIRTAGPFAVQIRGDITL